MYFYISSYLLPGLPEQIGQLFLLIFHFFTEHRYLKQRTSLEGPAVTEFQIVYLDMYMCIRADYPVVFILPTLFILFLTC